jgi:TATA element modulatory factor
LTSRVAALEKERDDLAKRESDVRRKAREVTSKSRRLEDELEAVTDKAKTLEQDLLEQKDSASKLLSRTTQAENAVQEAKESFERAKKSWDAELLQRLDEEKTKWRLEAGSSQGPTPTDQSFLRADSLSASVRKLSSAELYGLPARRSAGRINSDLTLPLVSERDRPQSRRQSTMPRSPDRAPPQRQDSTNSLSLLNGNSASRTPSIHAITDEPEPFDTASSQHRTIPDLISSSTNTGPSVQLVERMSAAVRRLESEKASTKEEMARMIAQRDEAREEVVALMREVDEKRKLDEKSKQLEVDLKQMNERYETTLEMLGEKSERVDELMHDVADLKKIYRDLLEKTLK